MLGLTLLITRNLRSNILRLSEVRGPMTTASLLAVGGLESSLADLRGWALVGDDRFRRDRRQAWSEGVDAAVIEMRGLGRLLEEEGEAARLDQVAGLLAELKEIQWWIEDVAQTPGNEPARAMLKRELQPVTDDIDGAISAMIDLENGSSDERPRAWLAAMADFRGSFMRSRASLNTFVDTAGSADALDFQSQLNRARRRLEVLTENVGWLDEDQRASWRLIRRQLPLYGSVAGNIVALRAASDWNIAEKMLREEAIPKSRQAGDLLRNIAEEQRRKMDEEATRLAGAINAAIGLSVALMMGMAVAAWSISRRGATALTQPIANLSRATRKMADGSLTEDIPVLREDELGELSVSFNRMRHTHSLTPKRC